LLFAVGAPAPTAVATTAEKASCGKLLKKYYKAVDAGNGSKAVKIRQKMVNKGCQNLPPPATPTA
jgi:hypothetical protein